MRAAFILLWALAIRPAMRAPMRTLLTLVGVALGVAMVVGTQASNRSIFGAFHELSDRAAGHADLEITGDESGLDQRLLEELAVDPGLAAHVAGRIEQPAIVTSNGRATRVLVLGVDLFGDPRFLPLTVATSGGGKDVLHDPLAFANDPHAIVIGETLAREGGYAIGATVSLRTAHGVEAFHVEAIVHETGASAAYAGQLVVLSLDAAQLAFARENKLDRIDVEAREGVSIERLSTELRARVGERAHVDPPAARAARLTRLTGAFTGGLEVAAMVAVMIGGFLVFNAVGIAVTQRRREIGVLRSLGANRGAIASVFLFEALILGALGGALGVWIGRGLARTLVAQFSPNVSRFFENIAAPAPKVDARSALFGVALGIVASLIAAWFPARRAARVAPIEALRRDLGAHVALENKPHSRALAALVVGSVGVALGARLGAGFGLAGVALLFVAIPIAAPWAVAMARRPLGSVAQRAFGIGGRIGVDRLVRSLDRSAQTVSALGLAAALGMTLSGYTHSYEATCMAWVEAAIPADVVVSAGSPLLDHDALAVDAHWADIVRESPNVESVNRVRSLSVPYRDVRIEVASVESRLYLERASRSSFRRVVEGPFPIPVDALDAPDSPAALVSENLARKVGLHPGDTLTLPTPSGPHALRVAAIVLDYSNDQGWVLIDRAWMVAWWNDARLEAVHVYARPGVDPTALAAELRERIANVDSGDGGLFVTTSAALKKEIREVVHQTFGISAAAEGVALVVALLGALGTMIAAVIDRRPETAMLRAIGATRLQIVLAAAIEGASMGLLACALAAIVAWPAARVFVDGIAFAASGWRVAFVFAWGDVARLTLTMTTLTALSGAIASVVASTRRRDTGEPDDAG